MRKQVFGRHLKRDTNERKALFKGLASSLVLHERIETTEQKAKSIKGAVDKLVTIVKTSEESHARKLLERSLTGDAVKKMIVDIAPRFTNRPGGYTRIVRVGRRFNDDATMVLLEWVEKKTAIVSPSVKKAAKTKKTNTKKSATEKPVKKVAKKESK